MEQVIHQTYHLSLHHCLHASSLTLQDNLQICWQTPSPVWFSVKAVYQPNMHGPGTRANVLSRVNADATCLD